MNAVQLTDTAHTESGGAGAGNSYDGDYATKYTATVGPFGGGGEGAANVLSQHTFATIHHITRLRYKVTGTSTWAPGASGNQSSCQAFIDYKQGDNWINHETGTLGTNGGSTSLDADDSVDIADCQGIRIRCYIWAKRTCDPACGGSETATGNDWEVEAHFENRSYAGVV